MRGELTIRQFIYYNEDLEMFHINVETQGRLGSHAAMAMWGGSREGRTGHGYKDLDEIRGKGEEIVTRLEHTKL